MSSERERKLVHEGYALAVADVIAVLEDDDLVRGRSLPRYRAMLRKYHEALLVQISTCNDPTCSLSQSAERPADAEELN